MFIGVLLNKIDLMIILLIFVIVIISSWTFFKSIKKLKLTLDTPLCAVNLKLLEYLHGNSYKRKFIHIFMVVLVAIFVLDILLYIMIFPIVGYYPIDIALILNAVIILLVAVIPLSNMRVELYKNGIFINKLYQWDYFRGYVDEGEYIKLQWGKGISKLIGAPLYLKKNERVEEIIKYYLNEIK